MIEKLIGLPAESPSRTGLLTDATASEDAEIGDPEKERQD
jgi:hypothetical protein